MVVHPTCNRKVVGSNPTAGPVHSQIICRSSQINVVLRKLMSRWLFFGVNLIILSFRKLMSLNSLRLSLSIIYLNNLMTTFFCKAQLFNYHDITIVFYSMRVDFNTFTSRMHLSILS